MRRDVFDPANVKAFAEKVGAPERLKMLCLLTYADIKAVNPEAMTPWKADNLWQLYIASANYLSRSADERVHTDDHGSNLAHLRSLAPVAGKKINNFLEGLPQRYLRIHGVSDVLMHAEMAAQLGKDTIQLSLKQVRHWYELTLITTDRPFLFASVSGALAAWGMNIVKANAFSNGAGVVVDTFYFTDRFRTLELNLPEWERLKKSIADVIGGKADVARMLQDRLRSEKTNGTKVKIATQSRVRRRLLHPQHVVAGPDPGSTGTALQDVLPGFKAGMQYRDCPDRDGGADGDRRPLSHVRRREAELRIARPNWAARCGRNSRRSERSLRAIGAAGSGSRKKEKPRSLRARPFVNAYL